MKLTVLGCGTYISGAKKAASGYLIDNREQPIVLDLGFGAFKNLQKITSPSKINALFFTHFHPDHTTDLVPFLFHRFGLVDKKLAVPLQINIFGPPGIKDFFASLNNIWNHISKHNKIKVKEMQYSKEKFFGYAVSSKPVKHSKESIGYRVETNGKAIAYSGDTGFCDEIIDLGKNAELLVLECSFFDKKTDHHLTAEECGRIAEQANTKKLLLTHLLPETESKKKDVVSKVKERFSGKVLVAKDLMEVKV